MLLMTLSLINSITLICLTHPMSMGGVLLIQTIVVTLTIGFFHTNFWYSYILFLIMVSGMLVLFAYMTSVASNEKFMPSIKIFLMIMSIITMFIFMMMMADPYYSNMNNIFLETMTNTSMYNISMTKYFNYPNMYMMFLLIIYLLITLIAVVKITKIKMGPLRQTN
uniref:NADH dehydrogenase subunit 6 n=1 Tax=Trichogomphus mongol TaxID=2910522 RepID=UPI002000C4CC|nr:NADH dehydrogenase subunit 6 [Trichogomphus mongol]UNZ12727.1 NADH dehydrogenase subunit 6 [Trichogomphus mongol]